MDLKRLFTVISAVASVAAVSAQSYYDDDIYFNENKAPKAQKVVTTTVVSTAERDVDEYNRQGSYSQSAYSGTSSAETDPYYYSRQIARFDNPKLLEQIDSITAYDIVTTEPTQDIYVTVNNYNSYGYDLNRLYGWGFTYPGWTGYYSWGAYPWGYYGIGWGYGGWYWDGAWAWTPGWCWGGHRPPHDHAWDRPSRPWNPRPGNGRPTYGSVNHRPVSGISGARPNPSVGSGSARPSSSRPGVSGTTGTTRPSGSSSARPNSSYSGSHSSKSGSTSTYSSGSRNSYSGSHSSYSGGSHNSGGSSYRGGSGGFSSGGGRGHSSAGGAVRSSGGGRGRH